MRVAAFQRRPVLDDPRAVAASIADDVAWAAREGVSLAVFPEAYLDGHSYDRATVSARARTLDDPEVRHLARSLRRFPVTSIAWMFERRANAVRDVALVLHSGQIIGVYAKARPNEDGVQAGDDMPTFESRRGPVCREHLQRRQLCRPGSASPGKRGIGALLPPERRPASRNSATMAGAQHRQSHRSCARDRLLGHLIRCRWSLRQPGEPGLHGHHQPGRTDQSTSARRHDRTILLDLNSRFQAGPPI